MTRLDEFTQLFDMQTYNEIDTLVLKLRQDNALGNRSDWFNSWRRGFYAFQARIHGIQHHRDLLFEWVLRPHHREYLEAHMGGLLFNMDSALECLTYALNAVGYALSPDSFHKVSDDSKLRRINPKDVFGERPMRGYSDKFPNTQRHWLLNRCLIQQVIDYHDVSKHRQTIFKAGKVRSDVPPGFYERIGILEQDPKRLVFHPFEEILLSPTPKAPNTKQPESRDNLVDLRQLIESWKEFLHANADFIFDDLKLVSQ